MDVSEILKDPAEHGFIFLTETVKKNGFTSGNVPIVKVTDAQKFEATFPGVILASLDGSSVRVISQGVVRESWFSGTKGADQLKVKLVKRFLGIEADRLIYPGPDGQKFATEDEAKAAWQEWATQQ